jgi:hypothetical protein
MKIGPTFFLKTNIHNTSIQIMNTKNKTRIHQNELKKNLCPLNIIQVTSSKSNNENDV